MGKFHKGNISFERSWSLLHSLFECGVRNVVISPGSRSTPLTLAAAFHSGLKKHIIIDERSAGFFALGMGKSTGVPAVLICTSGTAVANYFPAVIEAAKSSTPLILLTADRPPADRISGAPQTINQINIFGRYPLFFQDAPEPYPSPQNLESFARIAEKAWIISSTGPGPVHINLPFDKPLEPDTHFIESVISRFNDMALDLAGNSGMPQKQGDESDGFTEGSAITGSSNVNTTSLTDTFKNTRKPVLILGPSNKKNKNLDLAVRNFSSAGIPVIRCAGAPVLLNGITGYDAFLRHISNYPELKPDLVIRTGLHPPSRGLELLLQACDNIEHIHFSDSEDFNDALSTVSKSVSLDLLCTVSSRLEPVDPAWSEIWVRKQNQFLEKRSGLLSECRTFTDGHAFNILSGLVPEDWLITLSNSFPVRDYDLFKPEKQANYIITNRGASGIDGIISTAAGACLASGKNGLLFIGDIAALHDSNALSLGSRFEKQTLIITVINNGGGNIFRMLPVAAFEQVYKTYFETPQNVRFDFLADANNINFKKVTSADELRLAFETLSPVAGMHLIECVTDADASMDIRRALWQLPE